MFMSLNAAALDRRTITSNTIWEMLYRSLETQVRDWVQFSNVSLWRGQEEDIVEDIIQESVSRTFADCAMFPSREREAITWKALKRICVGFASKYYLDLIHRDSHFVRAPLHKPTDQGLSIVYERNCQSERTTDMSPPTPLVEERSVQEFATSVDKQGGETLSKHTQQKRANTKNIQRCRRSTKGPKHLNTNVAEIESLSVHLGAATLQADISPIFRENLRARLLKIYSDEKITDTKEASVDLPSQAISVQNGLSKEELSIARSELQRNAIPDVPPNEPIHS